MRPTLATPRRIAARNIITLVAYFPTHIFLFSALVSCDRANRWPCGQDVTDSHIVLFYAPRNTLFTHRRLAICTHHEATFRCISCAPSLPSLATDFEHTIAYVVPKCHLDTLSIESPACNMFSFQVQAYVAHCIVRLRGFSLPLKLLGNHAK